ncbi:MAG: recombinase family protein, partial [Acidobacteriia bacterium]|nr:recombinase family protein [Terriglobia bacterium]
MAGAYQSTLPGAQPGKIQRFRLILQTLLRTGGGYAISRLVLSITAQLNFKQKGKNKMNKYSKKEDSSPLPGAAYIRYSSEMQSDSFSLDAQLRQIKDQAERDGVNIVQVFSDPAQSAYRKKFRPGINAMREAARQGDFKILYV